MRATGDTGAWYRRKLEDNRSVQSGHRVMKRTTPEHLHGVFGAAMTENKRVPPLTDFTVEIKGKS